MRFLCPLVFLFVSIITYGNDVGGLENARLAFEEGEFMKAVELAEENILEARRSGDSTFIFSSKKLLGDVYSAINQYELSQKNYLEALKLAESNNSNKDIADVALGIGTLYMKIDESETSLKYLRRSVSNYRSIDENEIGVMHSYQMMGIVYGNSGELDSSLFYFQQTLNQAISGGEDKVMIGGLLNNIGAIYSKQGKLDDALTQYDKALGIFKEVGNKRGEGVSISNIAYIKQKQGRFDESIQQYLMAVELHEEVDALHYLANDYENISYSYELNSQKDKALEFYKKHIELHDSLANKEMLTRIKNMEIKYEIDKKTQELELLEKENKIILQQKDLKDKQFNIILIISISLVVIAILVILSLRISLNNNKLKREILQRDNEVLEEDLSFKNKELENFALHLVSRNDVLNEVKDTLKQLRKQASEENNQAINELVLKIGNITKSSNELKALQSRIEEVNHSFFQRLNKKYPDLTGNERQLCALIRMGLSSKEIALLNNVSERAVITARHRLRKKINIQTDENLVDFLNQEELS